MRLPLVSGLRGRGSVGWIDDGAKRWRDRRSIVLGVLAATALGALVLHHRDPQSSPRLLPEPVVRFADLPRRAFIESISRRSAPALTYADELPASTAFSSPHITVVYARDTFAASSPLVSVVLTVFNQASIIERVIQGILTATAGPYELVVVFDGCTDDSAARSDASVAAWAAAREGSTYATTAPSADRRGLVRYTRVVLSESRFETLANNVGLEVARADHVVVIQDDMLMVDYGWDRTLAHALDINSDVAIVSGRCAHDVRADAFGNPVYAHLTGACRGHNYDVESATELQIRDVAIRGPLMLHLGRLAPLGTPFDPRFAPLQQDDHELSWRAATALGLKSASVPVSVHSDEHWSHQRSDVGGRPLQTIHAEERNWATLRALYADELATTPPATLEARPLPALPDAAAPRIVATVGCAGEFALLAAFIRRLRTHEPTVAVFIADIGLTVAERAQATSWSRVVVEPMGQAGDHTAAHAIGHLLLDRGGLILWLDPSISVTASLFHLFRSVAGEGFIASAGVGEGVIGVSAAHVQSVVSVTATWLACTLDSTCDSRDGLARLMFVEFCVTVAELCRFDAGLVCSATLPAVTW